MTNDANPAAPRLAVLIPCYNEARTIATVVEDFHRAIPEAVIYVFDNNSTDGTADAARAAGAIVRHEKRRGKGYVVSAMLEQIDADYYVIVDGDDTYPADRVRDLLAPVLDGRADMTVGARVARDQQAAYRRFHRFGNWLVCTMINLIFRARLRDIMSGYRAFNRLVAENLPIIAYGFDIETEMTVQCLYRRWIICEIPVDYRERPSGSVSKLNTFQDGLRVLFRILSLFRSYKPLTFFGGLGILLFLVAIASALAAGFLDLPDAPYYRTILAVAAFAFAAMSLVAASIGVIVQLINFRFWELDSLLRRRSAKRP